MTTVREASGEDLPQLLPLIADYQRFYGVERPDGARNRSFFGALVSNGARGRLLGAWDDERPVGYATLQWTWDTISARDVAVLYDLFVAEGGRGRGTGRALMEAAIAAAREAGFPALSWMTALDNRRAQALYETFPAQRSAWFEYTMAL